MTNPNPDRTRDDLAFGARKRAVQELDRFWHRVQDSVPRGTRLDVVVEIRTIEGLGTEREQQIEERVGAFANTKWWLNTVEVRFPGPDRSVVTLMDLDVRVVQVEQTGPEQDERGRPVVRQLVLALDGEQAQILVEADARPVPLLRRDHGDVDPLGSSDRLLLPDAFVQVPRGELLELVRHEDRRGNPAIGLQRTDGRPEIDVEVDGSKLVRSKEPHLLRTSGAITFRGKGWAEPVVLHYRLADADEARLGSGRTSADPTPLALVVQTGPRRTPLLIAPPPLDQPVRSKDFPISVGGTDDYVLDVDLLYTTASTADDPEEHWHVKLYGCPTPQHAQRLRRYLRTQADVISKVNGAGRALDPPIARVIAPVHVAQPLTAVIGEQTGIRSQPAVQAPVDVDRLTDWFGSAEVPQPDSYVIVVSPLLTPVHWAQMCEQPNLEELDALQAVAHGVALCHDEDQLHGDVTPDNVCLTDDGFVLVDGDAITPRDRYRELRRNRYFTSRAVLDVLDGRTPAGAPAFEVSAHDRFGFALVVVTALAGKGMTHLLLEPLDGTRRVDDHAQVVAELRGLWPPNAWSRLIDELSAPFTPGALQNSWDPVDWLARLRAAAGADRVARPQPVERTVAPAGDEFTHRLRDDVVARNHPGEDRGRMVGELLADRLLGEARKAQLVNQLWALAPLGLALFLLLGAIGGR